MHTQTPVTVTAIIDVQTEHRELVTQALQTAVRGTRQEDGCELYVLHQDVDHPDRLIMLERWRDEAALAAHAQGPAFLTLVQAITGKASLNVIKLRELA